MMKKILILIVVVSAIVLSGISISGTFVQNPDGWYSPDKDPTAVLDYSVDWTQWLAQDTLATSSWSADVGITVTATSFTTTVATVWLSGGTAGRIYSIHNSITTVGGRVNEQSFKIRVTPQ